MTKTKAYIAIDLKSFYASVECKERNRDPLTTNLVVADQSRTEKTICLAVSPSLKSYGIPGRPRLFEVVQKIKEVNNTRRWKALNRTFTGSSDDSTELNEDPALKVDYIVAPPRMEYYLEYSSKIYNIYLKYIAPEDIFPYSIDEVFIDATDYLNTYQMTARELAMTMIRDVLKTTGITATAGIGTMLYYENDSVDLSRKTMRAATGIMGAANHIGVEWCAASYPLLQGVLRKEWGFQGALITDMALQLRPGIVDKIFRNGGDMRMYYYDAALLDPDSPAALASLRRAVKNICYAYANSNLMQGYAPGMIVSYGIAPWRMMLYVFDGAVLIAWIIGIVKCMRDRRRRAIQKQWYGAR